MPRCKQQNAVFVEVQIQAKSRKFRVSLNTHSNAATLNNPVIKSKLLHYRPPHHRAANGSNG